MQCWAAACPWSSDQLTAVIPLLRNTQSRLYSPQGFSSTLKVLYFMRSCWKFVDAQSWFFFQLEFLWCNSFYTLLTIIIGIIAVYYKWKQAWKFNLRTLNLHQLLLVTIKSSWYDDHPCQCVTRLQPVEIDNLRKHKITQAAASHHGHHLPQQVRINFILKSKK